MKTTIADVTTQFRIPTLPEGGAGCHLVFEADLPGGPIVTHVDAPLAVIDRLLFENGIKTTTLPPTGKPAA